jgi:hypothetical protein
MLVRSTPLQCSVCEAKLSLTGPFVNTAQPSAPSAKRASRTRSLPTFRDAVQPPEQAAFLTRAQLEPTLGQSYFVKPEVPHKLYTYGWFYAYEKLLYSGIRGKNWTA